MGDRRRMVCYLLAAVMALSGCSVRETERETESEKVTLEVYAWQHEKDNLELLADAFMKQNPEIRISMNFIPDEESIQTLKTAKRRGEQIDCILVPSLEKVSVMDKNGLIKNIKEDIIESGLAEAHAQWYADSNESCQSCAVPYRMSRWAVYYNKKIFDAMNVDYPTGDWSWDDYAKTAEKLTGILNGKKVYGSLSFEPGDNWWRVPARTAGANDPMVKEDLEKFRQSAEWCYHLTYDLGAQKPYTEQMGNSSVAYNAAFLEGNVAMYFSGDWSIQSLNEEIEEKGLDFEYDLAPMPYWEGEERYVIRDAALILMTAFTDYPEETFAFMEFASGEEGAKVLAENQVLPALDTESVIELYENSVSMPEHVRNLFQEGKTSRLPSNPLYHEAMNICRIQVEQYLIQEQSLKKTFDNIEEQLKELDAQESQ